MMAEVTKGGPTTPRLTFTSMALLLGCLGALPWTPGAAWADDDVRCNAPQLCEAWSAIYDGPGHAMDFLLGAAVSHDGARVFLTGQAYWSGGNQTDLVTVAYDAVTGVQLWAVNYNGPGNGNDYGAEGDDVQVSPDNAVVFVVGRSPEPGGGTQEDFATVAYASDSGQQLWAARYDGGDDRAMGVAVSPEGSVVYAAGRSDGEAVVVAYDAATGQQLWSARNPDDGSVNVIGLALGPGGSRLYLVGERTAPTGEKDFVTVAFDLVQRSVAWTALYDGPDSLPDFGYAAAVSPDGSRVFVTGYSYSTQNQSNVSDYVTLAYDAATGARQWVQRYSGDAIGQVAEAIAVDAAGEVVFITGSSLSLASSWDAVTVAYAASTGQQLWLTRLLDGPTERTFGRALRLAPGGRRLYVVGSYLPTGSMQDVLTVAYNADTGAQVWKLLWTPTGVDLGQADAVAMSPDGTRIHVAGSVRRSQQVTYDIGIVSYGPLTLAPSATLSADPVAGDAPLEVEFSLSGSDPDLTGAVASWRLDVDGDGAAEYSGDGSPPATLIHTYTSPGIFHARLTIGDDHGAIGTDEDTVMVTSPVGVEPTPALAWALRGVRPNPTARDLVISFSLPSAEPARLELLDLAGRMVVSREVGGLGAGDHQLDLGRGTRLASGAYVVRLTQGAKSLSRKAMVIR